MWRLIGPREMGPDLGEEFFADRIVSGESFFDLEFDVKWDAKIDVKFESKIRYGSVKSAVKFL